MKFAEFKAFCDEEWKLGNEVATLWLTEDSCRELVATAGAYINEGQVAHTGDDGTSPASRVIYDQRMVPSNVSIHSSLILNPATRGTVRMKLARDRDAADVWTLHGLTTRLL